jgi:beta-1,4-glucosyltransferase
MQPSRTLPAEPGLRGEPPFAAAERSAVDAKPTARSGAAVHLGGFRVRNTRGVQLMRFLKSRMRQDRKIAVGFVNHNFVTTCQDLGCEERDKSAFLLVNDGIGMQIAALLRFGHGFRENLNGTDFVPRFLRAFERPLAIYLVGAKPEVVATAAAAIAAIPPCRVVGFCDGYSVWHREEHVLTQIAAARPDVLLVALGNPLQEQWILRHWDRLDAKVIFGVGALFDWMAGRHRRAPVLVRSMRLEWVYRLALEPRRLGRRYTLGVLHFFSLVMGGAVPLSGRGSTRA